jgi:hypothetical protein
MIGMTDARLRSKGTKGSNMQRIQRNSATLVSDKRAISSVQMKKKQRKKIVRVIDTFLLPS